MVTVVLVFLFVAGVAAFFYAVVRIALVAYCRRRGLLPPRRFLQVKCPGGGEPEEFVIVARSRLTGKLRCSRCGALVPSISHPAIWWSSP